MYVLVHCAYVNILVYIIVSFVVYINRRVASFNSIIVDQGERGALCTVLYLLHTFQLLFLCVNV